MEKTLREVIDLKDEIEQAVRSRIEEKLSLKQEIKFIEDQQENTRRSISAKAMEKLKVEIELDKLDQEIEMLKDYCKSRHQQQNDFMDSINDQVQMTDFEGAMMSLRQSIESAIVFYREDTLQMELLKQQDTTRMMRIDCTKAENDYKQRIEEQERKAEEERRKAEEEQRRAEEAKRLAEEQRIREEERRSKGLVSEAPILQPERLKSPSSGRSSVNKLSTFTQLLRWQ